MAMKEPRTRVVSLEPDDAGAAFESDNVATGRVDVVGWAAITLNDVECMAVETEKGAGKDEEVRRARGE